MAFGILLRTSIAATALVGLAGCSAIQETPLVQDTMGYLASGPKENDKAELGLAELAKGDNVAAQTQFESALASNPQDALALYGLGVLYHNSGQLRRASELYQTLLAMVPPPTDELMVWAGREARPVTELALVNLRLLESGQVAPVPGTAVLMGYPGETSTGPEPTSQLLVMPNQPSVETQQQMTFADADLNTAGRFRVLRDLLNQGLITQDEFVVRRRVNLGALLPLTVTPPAVGLDRPVPEAEQIANRLRAIGRALEMRAISPTQHGAERSMILDALMPANPRNRANPPSPPQGLMESADMVRRLEMLKQANLITSSEYTRERAAIEAAMQPEPTPPPPMAQGGGAASSAQTKGLSGFRPGVHLASYRRVAVAQRGWQELSKRFSGDLGALQSQVEKVDLGSGKGIFYRLKAGPLPSNDAAKALCRKLKAQRQYCEPTTINFGG